jgi:hypothetical protein
MVAVDYDKVLSVGVVLGSKNKNRNESSTSPVFIVAPRRFVYLSQIPIGFNLPVTSPKFGVEVAASGLASFPPIISGPLCITERKFDRRFISEIDLIFIKLLHLEGSDSSPHNRTWR